MGAYLTTVCAVEMTIFNLSKFSNVNAVSAKARRKRRRPYKRLNLEAWCRRFA